MKKVKLWRIFVSYWECILFAQLESLIVLSRSQTMADAAVKLRISQSALSKRIKKLEQSLGFAVIEYQGRNAKLTARAVSLLASVEPLVAQITDAIQCAETPARPSLSIAIADAIMVSWGARLMVAVKKQFPDIQFELHSHRTATVIERLSRGRYQIGLCTGIVPQASGLIVSPLVEEPMAVVIAEPFRANFEAWLLNEASLDICCIERNSAMWAFLQPHFKAWKFEPHVTIESSVGAARLAVEGYSHALVPLGVAEAVVPNGQFVVLDGSLAQGMSNTPLSRPCSMVSRKSVLNHSAFSEVFSYIHQYAEGVLKTN